MKIYIATDMEGVSGIVNPKQCEPGTPEYEEARTFLCGDVNAAIEGAFEGGAKEVVVCDGHGGGFNFIMEKMHENASYEKPDGARNIFPSLDRTYDGFFEIGAHAMAGTKNAFFDHTQSWTDWLNYYLNGKKYGEIGQMATIAGYYDVPLLLVSGDEAACKEASELVKGVEVVAVKKGISRFCARTLPPSKAHTLIKEAAKRAVQKAKKIKPIKLHLPIEVKIELTRTDPADILSAREAVERLDARTVRKIVNSPLDILNI